MKFALLEQRRSEDGGRVYVYDIKERDVPEQLVLTETRRLRPLEVPIWINSVLERLSNAAVRYGGSAGAPFVVYHGPIGEDSDGPAEACVPVASAFDTADDPVEHDARTSAEGSNLGHAVRREPAHREIYVTLTKAHVVYPKIKLAYAAVAQWIASHELVVAGPPREVYFADFDAAGADDDVCDVAFPVL